MIRIPYDIISNYKVYYIGLNFVRPFQPPVLFVPYFPVLHFLALHIFLRHFPVLHFSVLHFQSLQLSALQTDRQTQR